MEDSGSSSTLFSFPQRIPFPICLSLCSVQLDSNSPFHPLCSPPPCSAPSRSAPCPLPAVQRSPVLGSAVGSEDEDTKAPKTVLKSQSVNLYRKHTSSFYNAGSHTRTHTHTHTHMADFDRRSWRWFNLGFWEKIAHWYLFCLRVFFKIKFI